MRSITIRRPYIWFVFVSVFDDHVVAYVPHHVYGRANDGGNLVLVFDHSMAIVKRPDSVLIHVNLTILQFNYRLDCLAPFIVHNRARTTWTESLLIP